MTDQTDMVVWPPEIWMAERDDYDQGLVYAVLSEEATISRWAGDQERDCEFHKYVDADIYESAERYWKHKCALMLKSHAQLVWTEQSAGVFWAVIPFGLYRIFVRSPKKFEAVAPSWPSDPREVFGSLEDAKAWAQGQHDLAVSRLFAGEKV